MVDRTCIMLLGADNVGKTSLKGNIMKSLGMHCKHTVYWQHFIKPRDPNQPFLESYEFLDLARNNTEYDTVYILDRGFPENYFYTKFRNGQEVDYGEVENLINEFMLTFNRFHMFVIKREWADIKRYHEEEIANNQGKCDESMDLGGRYVEYVSYYRFMEMFVNANRHCSSLLMNLPKWFTLGI